MVAIQEPLEADRTRWPPNILDTDVWARFVLNGEHLSKEDLQAMRDDLQRLVDRREVMSQVRRTVEGHITQIRRSIAERDHS
jgi:hypothetical protein